MPLKVKVTPPREGGGRVMSATDASKAKSTPPKTGTDAQMQRMNNTIKSFVTSGLTTGVIGKMYRNALEGAKGNNVSNADKQAMKNAKKDPAPYQRPPKKTIKINDDEGRPKSRSQTRAETGKAYGGKTKMMAGGKAKKK